MIYQAILKIRGKEIPILYYNYRCHIQHYDDSNLRRIIQLHIQVCEEIGNRENLPVEGDYPFFEVYRVKDLRKKEMITDVELDGLIEYFKEKKKLLDEAAGKAFRSNGQAYYWISRDLLP